MKLEEAAAKSETRKAFAVKRRGEDKPLHWKSDEQYITHDPKRLGSLLAARFWGSYDTVPTKYKSTGNKEYQVVQVKLIAG